MKPHFTIILSLVCIAPTIHAQSLEQLDQLSHIDKALDLLDQLQARVDQQVHATKYSCLKVFGNDAFCGCISSNLPIVFSFADYVAIVTQTKENNGYASLNTDTKKAYDSVPAVREKCVAQSQNAS